MPVLEGLNEQAKILEKKDEDVARLAYKVVARVARVADEDLVGIMKASGTNRNKLYIRGAFICVNRNIMTTLLEGFDVREVFEFAIILVVASGRMLQMIAHTIAKEEKLMTPGPDFSPIG